MNLAGGDIRPMIGKLDYRKISRLERRIQQWIRCTFPEKFALAGHQGRSMVGSRGIPKDYRRRRFRLQYECTGGILRAKKMPPRFRSIPLIPGPNS